MVVVTRYRPVAGPAAITTAPSNTLPTSRLLEDPFDIRTRARRRLPRMMFDFIEGGTGREMAAQTNRAALDGLKLQSRALVNVEQLETTTALLGAEYGLPFGIAPMGMCNLISPNADLALSRQARARNIPHCVSTAASTTLEDTFIESGGNAWFQLYAGSDADVTFEMVDRAQAAGYQHLVFTVDTPRHSRRTRDLSNGFAVPFNIGPKQFTDFALHPQWSISRWIAGVPKPMNYEVSKFANGFQRGDSRGGADWALLDRLRKRWKGKMIVKGIMSPEDALRVRDAGCDAVYVSNHGGRQLDSAAAAVHALRDIRDAIGPDYTLIYDSGIRTADDIVKALAVGADFIMLGRPMLYALGAGGEDGLNRFLDLMEGDLPSVMAQIGATSIGAINRSCLTDKDNPNHD